MSLPCSFETNQIFGKPTFHIHSFPSSDTPGILYLLNKRCCRSSELHTDHMTKTLLWLLVHQKGVQECILFLSRTVTEKRHRVHCSSSWRRSEVADIVPVHLKQKQAMSPETQRWRNPPNDPIIKIILCTLQLSRQPHSMTFQRYHDYSQYCHYNHAASQHHDHRVFITVTFITTHSRNFIVTTSLFVKADISHPPSQHLYFPAHYPDLCYFTALLRQVLNLSTASYKSEHV